MRDMESLSLIIFFVVVIILTVTINRIYHKIFGVTYFGFKAILSEWATCFIIAFLIIAGIASVFIKGNPERDKGQKEVASETRTKNDDENDRYDEEEGYHDGDEEQGFILAEEQEDFINAHNEFFPVSYDGLDGLEPYINYDPDYTYMTKNPLRYNGTFAFLEDLQVLQIWDGYDGLKEMELKDVDGNRYHIFCPEMRVDVIERDFVRAIAMPLASIPYEGADGRTVLVMIAALVEDMSAPEISRGFFSGAEEYPEIVAEDTREGAVAVSENPYGDSLLLWKSFYEPLSQEDVVGLSADELRIARNEIYAAYGRQFSSTDLQTYFGGKDWYSGTIPPDQFSESMLTEIQKRNIELISSYERKIR